MPRRHEGYGELAVRSIDATSSAQPPPATLKIQQLLIGRWWLTLGVLVSTVLGSIFCLTARHRSMYQSQATIQILPYKAQSLQLESEFRTGHNYDSFMNTQATLLRSRPILTRVLDGLHQDARYDEQTAKWTIDTLAGGVVTEVPRRTQLIKVRFTHPNPQIAQAVVDSVTQIYLESLEQGLIDTDLHRLRQANSRLDELRQRHEQLSQQSVQARMALTAAFDRLNDAQRRESDNPSLAIRTAPRALDADQTPQDPRTRQCVEALTQAKLEYSQMQERFSDRHPAMIRLSRRIAMYEQTLAEIERRRVESTPQTTASATTSTHPEPPKDDQALNSDVVRHELELTQLSHQLAYTRKLIEQLTQRTDQLKNESGLAGQINLIESANLPTEPVEEQAYKDIVTGSIIGVALGLALLIGINLLDHRCHLPALITEQKDIAMLGEVPAFNPKAPSIATESIHRTRVRLQAGGLGDCDKVAVVTASQTGGGATTACISLGASLAAGGLRTLLIDADMQGRSMSRQFGCAVLRNFEDVLRTDGRIDEADLMEAANQVKVREMGLRETLFELGYPVDQAEHMVSPAMQQRRNQLLYEVITEMQLLPMLEAQLLMQRCHTQPRGLSDALAGEPIRHCVTSTDVDGLYLLPSNDGDMLRNDAIGAEPLKQLLQRVREQYDVVLIDTPSLDESLAAVLFASHADCSVLVVPQRGALSDAHEAVTLLSRAGSTSPAMLFNRFGRGRADGQLNPLAAAMLSSCKPAVKSPVATMRVAA